jgi:hypothetical protein
VFALASWNQKSKDFETFNEILVAHEYELDMFHYQNHQDIIKQANSRKRVVAQL